MDCIVARTDVAPIRIDNPTLESLVTVLMFSPIDLKMRFTFLPGPPNVGYPLAVSLEPVQNHFVNFRGFLELQPVSGVNQFHFPFPVDELGGITHL